jgi:NAD(P)-dependent dehydrogenase (short-subunit alcohol dehydrogenase family)
MADSQPCQRGGAAEAGRRSSYVASKAAVISLTEVLARELSDSASPPTL